jgi:hypothetical protein
LDYDPHSIQGRKERAKLGTKRQDETGEGTDFGAFPTFTVVTRLCLPNPKKLDCPILKAVKGGPIPSQLFFLTFSFPISPTVRVTFQTN